MNIKSTLATKIKAVAELKGRFELRSGAVSDTYFDKYLFESDPVLLKEIGTELATLVPSDTEVLAGLEMGGIPVVTVLSQITGLPAAFVRKEAKEYGTCKFAEGPNLVGKKVVIVEDVVSSGGAILDALEKLSGDGIKPIGIVCVIDRETGGFENLQKVGYRLDSVLTASDLQGDT